MEFWIPITIAAAFSQNIRSALQKRLKATLSTLGATSARFVFAAPIAAVLLVSLLIVRGQSLPEFGFQFIGYSVVGCLAQILASALLIHLFSFQNFTVATTLTKTETIQTALFGVLLLGDKLSPLIGLAILVSLVGVILISMPPNQGTKRRAFDKKALIGIVSGALFGLSAVAYRGASLSIFEGDVFLRASMTLALVTSMQAIIVLVWLRLKEPGQTTLLFQNRKLASCVGLAGMLASLAWFTAFTLENAAHVRALGQIEIIFMLGASVFLFKERITAREISGVLLVSAGILGLVMITA